MEWIKQWGKQYRALLLIALLGIALLLVPQTSEPMPEPTEAPAETTLEDSLEALLSKISGAGQVELLLSEASGPETLYQMDERITGDSAQRDTVMISGQSREETGLVRQTKGPVYQGAVVLCQGADRAEVRLAIVEAVKCATGLSSDKITVLKGNEFE